MRRFDKNFCNSTAFFVLYWVGACEQAAQLALAFFLSRLSSPISSFLLSQRLPAKVLIPSLKTTCNSAEQIFKIIVLRSHLETGGKTSTWCQRFRIGYLRIENVRISRPFSFHKLVYHQNSKIAVESDRTSKIPHKDGQFAFFQFL